MKGLVYELQKYARNSQSCTTDDLLRMSLYDASRFSIDDEHVEWLRNESCGYKTYENLKDYRRILGTPIIYNEYNQREEIPFENFKMEQEFSKNVISSVGRTQIS